MDEKQFITDRGRQARDMLTARSQDGRLADLEERIDQANAHLDVAKLFRSGVVKKKYDVLVNEIETITALDPNYLQRLGNLPFAYDILSKIQSDSTLLKFMGEVSRKEKSEDNAFV